MTASLDSWLPGYHVRSRHSRASGAAPSELWRAAQETTLGELRVTRPLLALRGLGSRPVRRDVTFRELSTTGNFRLLEEGARHSVSGLAGRFWTPSGGAARLESAADYKEYDEPGTAKAAVLMAVEENGSGSTLITETRVRCADPGALRRFRAYWLVVGPFSGLIRRDLLAAIVRRAERPEF